MGKQAASYRYRLNALLTEAQLQGEYLGGYRVHVEKGGIKFIWGLLVVTRSAGSHPFP